MFGFLKSKPQTIEKVEDKHVENAITLTDEQLVALFPMTGQEVWINPSPAVRERRAKERMEAIIKALCSGSVPAAIALKEHLPELEALAHGIYKGIQPDWLEKVKAFCASARNDLKG